MQERDLRSLERRSMYSIFAPLDPNERLPRELLLEAKRQRSVGRRELAGALWIPGLVVVMTIAAWKQLSAGAIVAAVGAMFVGFGAFALSGDRQGRH
jgi:hypothetical protein